jgi:hypothetical protein
VTPLFVGVVAHRVKHSRSMSMTIQSGRAPGVQGDVRLAAPAAGEARARRLLDSARGELGYREGPNNYNKFSPHLGMQNVPWCAAFVSQLLERTGTGQGILKGGGSASVANLKQQFAEAGRYRAAPAYTPQPGDVIFFSASHTGIVERVENGKVYTIEGNTSNSVARRCYAVGDRGIVGYGQTIGERLAGNAGGGPANLDVAMRSAKTVVRDSGSFGTGYEGPGTGNERGARGLWKFLVNILDLTSLLELGEVSDEDVADRVRDALPDLDAEYALKLARALKTSPSLVAAIQARPHAMQFLATRPSLIDELVARGSEADVARILGTASAPDGYEQPRNPPLSPEALHPSLEQAPVPEGTATVTPRELLGKIQG